MRKMSAPFPWFVTTFTLLAFLILVGLGGWQMHRLAWKTGLLEFLESEYQKNALEYPLQLVDLIKVTETTPVKGFISGQFNFKQEIKVGPRRENGVFGYDIFTPFYLTTGGVVLVDRGWIKSSDSDPKNRPQTLTKGRQVLTGVARLPLRPWKIGPDNIAERNVWIYPSPTQVAQAKGIANMAPTVFHLETSSAPARGLLISKDRWQPRNKHLQYAIFWFAMAGVLLSIYYVRFLRKSS